MQLCCESRLLLRVLPNLNWDSGLQQWAINSYTTTGQFAAVSSAHKAGCLHNHTLVVPVAKTRAQSAPATFSPPHKAFILITLKGLLFSCSRPGGNKQQQTANGKLAKQGYFLYKSQPAQKGTSWSALEPGHSYTEHTCETTEGTKAIYVHEKKLSGSQKTVIKTYASLGVNTINIYCQMSKH